MIPECTSDRICIGIALWLFGLIQMGRHPGGRPRPDSGALRKTSVDMDLDDLSRLDRIARARGVSRQALLRQIVRRWLRRQGQVR